MNVFSVLLNLILTAVLIYLLYRLYQRYKDQQKPDRPQPGPEPQPDTNVLNSYNFTPPTDCQSLSSLSKEHVTHKRRINKLNPFIPKKFKGQIVGLTSLTTEPEPPQAFTWRGKLTPVLDQENCGTCWAFATTSTLADKIAIKTGNTILQLSPMWTITNTPYYIQNDTNHYDCNNGNSAYYAIELLMTKGCKEKSCWPYHELLKPYRDTYLFPQALGLLDDTCCYNCCKNSPNTYFVEEDSIRTPDYSQDEETVTKFIQNEIYKNGPVVAQMYVSTDFQAFWNRGIDDIYMMKYNDPDGWHAVEIIGWGYDETTHKRYWEVKNSWGNSGPDNGYFKIAFSIDTPKEQRVFIDIPDTNSGAGGIIAFSSKD